MSVRRRDDDDDGPIERQMLDMSAETLRECEDLYNAWKIGGYHKPKKSLERTLTGRYNDSMTGGHVKYMKYSIPSSASPGLKGYMENLKEEYEALHRNKRSRIDVDDSLPDSISPQNRARIIELRGYIESNRKSQEETIHLINRWTDLISFYQRQIRRSESNSELYDLISFYQRVISRLRSTSPLIEQSIQRYQAEIESLGGGTAHTGSQFHAGMRHNW